MFLGVVRFATAHVRCLVLGQELALTSAKFLLLLASRSLPEQAALPLTAKELLGAAHHVALRIGRRRLAQYLNR